MLKLFRGKKNQTAVAGVEKGSFTEVPSTAGRPPLLIDFTQPDANTVVQAYYEAELNERDTHIPHPPGKSGRAPRIQELVGVPPFINELPVKREEALFYEDLLAAFAKQDGDPVVKEVTEAQANDGVIRPGFNIPK